MTFSQLIMKNQIKNIIRMLSRMIKPSPLLLAPAKEAHLKEGLIRQNIFVKNFFSIINKQAKGVRIERDSKEDTREKEIS